MRDIMVGHGRKIIIQEYLMIALDLNNDLDEIENHDLIQQLNSISSEGPHYLSLGVQAMNHRKQGVVGYRYKADISNKKRKPMQKTLRNLFEHDPDSVMLEVAPKYDNPLGYVLEDGREHILGGLLTVALGGEFIGMDIHPDYKFKHNGLTKAELDLHGPELRRVLKKQSLEDMFLYNPPIFEYARPALEQNVGSNADEIIQVIKEITH
ncbi:hypothetical protein ACFL96_09320 [Thermoproteota archaeon]